MNNQGVAQDIARFLQPRSARIIAPYVHEHSTSDAPETGVREVYNLVLNIDGTGCHYTCARGWAQTHMKKDVDPTFFYFNVLVLESETLTEGSQRPIADKESEPALYAQTVKLAALKILGRATKQQQVALSSLVTSDRLVDLRFAHDIEIYKRTDEQKADKSTKKDADAEEEGEDGEEGGGAIEYEEIPMLPVAPPSYAWVDNIVVNTRDDMSSCIIDIDPAIDSDVKTCTQRVCEWYLGVANGNMRLIPKNRPKKRAKKVAAAAAAEEDAASAEGAAEAEPAPELAPFPEGVPYMVPKISFTVTPLPVQGGDIHVQQDIVCVLVRFLVRDPAINPGRFFDRILSNVRARARRLTTPGRIGASGFEEMFPGYSTFYYSHHPAGNNVTLQTYFTAATKLSPDLLIGTDKNTLFNSMNYVNKESPMHMRNLLTIEKALDVMRSCKVDSRYTRSAAQWWNRDTKTALFPDKYAAPTYKYHPYQVFWFDAKYVGLSEQFFPHIDTDQDFFTKLMGGGSIDKFLDIANGAAYDAHQAEEKINTTFEAVRVLIRDNFLIDRNLLYENKLIDYETTNEFVHRAAEANLMNARIQQEFPSHFSKTMDEVLVLKRQKPDTWEFELQNPDLEKRIFECRKYSQIRNKAQLACMKSFAGLWVTDGEVDDLPVPLSIKKMLMWYRDNHHSKFPNMTREFMKWDPKIGLFGNSMMRQLKMYACVAKILQPIICLLAEGLFSCYHWSPSELCFNMLAHGRYDVGKTFAAITTLMKYTTIQGTVKEYCVATAAADTTLNHNYDLIIACDEVMPWKVNSKEAEKCPERVNKEKIKLTRRQIGLEAFSFEKTPAGETMRWCRTYTTDHYVSLIEVTNAVVESTNALSSRYHRMTIAQPRIPARELAGVMGATLKSSTTTYLQINQYLSACGYKASMCGALMPSPEMQMFDDVSNRVIQYLVEVKAVSSDVGSRGLEIMKPYARQLVYHMAIHCAFDMPGAPCYQKKFETSMIREIQPYLYVTTEIIWWCWTSLASGWIEEQNSNVIRAACKVAGVVWEDGTSPYTVYEHDMKKEVGWKIKKNADTSVKDNDLIDINYIMLHGTKEQICRNISQKTSPHLDWTDVMGVLNVLSTTQVAPPGGAFTPQVRNVLEKWHMFKTLPTKGNEDGVKPVGADMPEEYKYNNNDFFEMRGENDFPKLPADTTMPVVDLVDMNNKKLYIMPSVCGSYRNKTIVSALLYATMCRSFPEGKLLLGTPNDDDPTQMQVFSCPKAMINAAVRKYDLDIGYSGVDAYGKPVWVGDPDIDEDERPVSRQVGIAFNRRGGIAAADQDFFTAVPAMPVVPGDTKWSDRCKEDIRGMEQAREVCVDLDYESAKRQHMACGRGVDEVVMSPAYVNERYIQACKEIPGRLASLDKDYPHDWLPEAEKRKAIWEASAATKHAAAISDDVYKMGMETHNMPRKNAIAQQIAARKVKAQHSKRDRESRDSLLSSGGATMPAFGNDEGEVEAMQMQSRQKRSSAMVQKKKAAHPPPPPLPAASVAPARREVTQKKLAELAARTQK